MAVTAGVSPPSTFFVERRLNGHVPLNGAGRLITGIERDEWTRRGPKGLIQALEDLARQYPGQVRQTYEDARVPKAEFISFIVKHSQHGGSQKGSPVVLYEAVKNETAQYFALTKETFWRANEALVGQSVSYIESPIKGEDDVRHILRDTVTPVLDQSGTHVANLKMTDLATVPTVPEQRSHSSDSEERMADVKVSHLPPQIELMPDVKLKKIPLPEEKGLERIAELRENPFEAFRVTHENES